MEPVLLREIVLFWYCRNKDGRDKILEERSMVSSMVTGGILGRYEHAFAVITLLVTFIPMLTDTGGNAGSQSSTLIIRGIRAGKLCSVSPAFPGQ